MLQAVASLTIIIYDRNMFIIKATDAQSIAMERHALKNVNQCLNTNIYSYLETSVGQSSNLYFNVVHFFNASDN
jgi:hypothetical protein